MSTFISTDMSYLLLLICLLVMSADMSMSMSLVVAEVRDALGVDGQHP